MGGFEEAEAFYKEAIKTNPKNSDAHYNLGVTLGKLGRLEEAEASYRKAIKINPNHANAHYNLGVTLGKLERLEEAEASYRKAIRINPKNSDAHCNLGVALYELGRLEEAEASYRKAIKINRNRPEFHANLGLLLFKEALEINPKTAKLDDAKLHFGFAMEIFAEKGRKEDAEYMRGYAYWIEGFKWWRIGNLEEAEKSYVSASESFRKAERGYLALTLTMIAEYFRIDREYLGYINSKNLAILRNGIANLSQKIQKSLHKIKGLHGSILEMEILQARALCIQSLGNVLLFEPIESERLEVAKHVFSKHHFLKAYEAANAIDTFANYLNHFSPNKNLNEITKEQEKKLFAKLNPATELDGIVTQRVAKMIAESLKPELYSTIAEPITERIDALGEKLEERLESILAIVQQNPKRVQTLLNEQLGELRQILLETADQLKDKDPQKAKEAKKWYDYLVKGISVTADVIQIVTFLTGIPSLPSLASSDITTRAAEFLKRFKRIHRHL